MLHSTTPSKFCTICGDPYPATAEYFHRGNGRYGLRAACKSCTLTKNQKYFQDNRETILEKGRAYYREHRPEYAQRARQYAVANRKKMVEAQKRFSAAHPDRVRSRRRRYYERTRDVAAEQHRKWVKEHPEQARAIYHRRRARRLGAKGYHTAQDIKKIYASQKGRCWWCKKKVGNKYHVDHRVPLAKGGTNWPNNLVISCPTCNHRKGPKLPSDFNGRLL